MKIAVNCTKIDTSKTLGVLRFGQRLVKAIRNAMDAEVVGLVPPEKINDLVFWDTFKRIIPISPEESDKEMFDVELLLHHFQIPCTQAPSAMIFHDLHLWDVPWKYANPPQMKEDLTNIVKNIDALIVHFPRTYYDLPKVIPEVGNGLFLTFIPIYIEYVEENPDLTSQTRTKYSISENEKVLLYPAQLQPHKNHLNLFRAMKILERLPIKLVCTGSELQKDHANMLYQFISEMGLSEKIVMTGNIKDQELENIYHVADLVVFPGMAEDGATIAQEAIVYGKKVIYSDIRPARLHLEKMCASIPLFNPMDPKDIAETISSALNTTQDNAQAKAVIESWTFDRLAGLYCRVFNWLNAGSPSGEMPMFLDESLGYLRRL